MTHSYLIVFIFGLIIFLPTALYKYVQASSMSFGLSLSLVALVAYLTLSRRRLFFEMRFVLLIVFSLLLVLVLSTFSYFFDEVYFEFSRFIGSFFYLAIVLILSYCFCLLLVDVNESLFRRTLNSIFYLLAFDGLYSTIGYYFFGQAKNLILFTEPSHFAIAFSPFFLYQMVENYNVKFRLICIILVVAFISIIFKSLVLLASLFVALLIVLKKRDAIIYAILCSFIVFINISELSYFITRLDFSGESKNLSVLVFLSGYERAFLSIKDTFGLGIGFQQMGYLEVAQFFLLNDFLASV